MSPAALKFIGLSLGLSAVIVLGVVGFKQLQKNQTFSNLTPGKTPSSQNQSSTKNPNSGSTQPSGRSSELPALPASPSAAQQTEYLNAAKAAAKEVTTVTFTNCKPDVPAIKLKKGTPLTLKNADNALIVLDVGSKNTFPVQPLKDTTANLSVSTGFNFMACQHSSADYNQKALVIEVVE